MKIRITRSKFLDGLKKVQNIVASKGSVQIIQNVLICAKDKQLYLTTTDLDISIRSVVQCEVLTEGETTLPVKLLSESIAKVAEGVVEIETDADDKAIISAGTAIFNIAGMNVADFPQLPQDSNSFAYTMNQMTLREMLRKTAYAASKDDSRKTLKGVLMSFVDGKLTMVATDGRRLALVEHEVEFPEDQNREIVLPTKVVSELQRSLSSEGSVSVTVEKSQVAFNMGDTQIYSKLIDDVYPNYRQVIPGACSERITIDRKALLDALDRVSIMTVDKTNSNSTRLTFEANRLTVASAAAEVGAARDTVPIKYDGNTIEIVFNPQFVMDPLKAIDEDEIFIELSNSSSPALIKCSVSFLYVMMPLRTN